MLLSNLARKNIALLIIITVIISAVITFSYAAVPNSTPADTTQQYNNGTSIVRADYIVCDGDYYWQYNGTLYNITQAIASLLGVNATNEWGLVYGTTGDWFNYTDITYTPVYLGLQMHPLNLTIAGDYVIPNVYDKDDYHWQLELVWLTNGTQCNHDCLVMYYAHVEWDNEDGLEYLEPNNEEEPV